jgi:signal transduction histidine kinase
MFDVGKMNVDLPRFRAGSTRAYLIAAAILSVATVIRVEVPTPDWMPYLTFFPAIVFITLICGGAAGLVATLLSIGLAEAFLMPDPMSFDAIYRTGIFAVGSFSVVFVAGAVRHATALMRRLNATLQQSEAKFRGLLESAPDAMVIVDGTGHIALVNAATERLFGYPRTQLLGQPAEMLMPATADGELVGIRNGGTVFPIEVSHSPLQTEGGSMVSSAIRDVTERKRIEVELMQASRAKTDFLSGMSHELRTPLNAVVGFAELLQMKSVGSLTPKQQEYVGHILEGGNHLLVLVTQLLDLAGIEAGRLNLSVAPVDVRGILRYVYGLMSPLAQQAGVEFVLTIPPEIADARADELRLRQVLINFLSNAIKYNRTGGQVVLTAEAIAETGIRFTVTDTGLGIPPDRTDELFQPFNRLGAEHSKVSGTGIGLAFSRKVVEAMGGTVGFASEVGKGSVFWVDMPAESPWVPVAAPSPSVSGIFNPFAGDEALSPA